MCNYSFVNSLDIRCSNFLLKIYRACIKNILENSKAHVLLFIKKNHSLRCSSPSAGLSKDTLFMPYDPGIYSRYFKMDVGTPNSYTSSNSILKNPLENYLNLNKSNHTCLQLNRLAEAVKNIILLF